MRVEDFSFLPSNSATVFLGHPSASNVFTPMNVKDHRTASAAEERVNSVEQLFHSVCSSKENLT